MRSRFPEQARHATVREEIRGRLVSESKFVRDARPFWMLVERAVFLEELVRGFRVEAAEEITWSRGIWKNRRLSQSHTILSIPTCQGTDSDIVASNVVAVQTPWSHYPGFT
jgi:hypothetical protein